MLKPQSLSLPPPNCFGDLDCGETLLCGPNFRTLPGSPRPAASKSQPFPTGPDWSVQGWYLERDGCSPEAQGWPARRVLFHAWHVSAPGLCTQDTGTGSDPFPGAAHTASEPSAGWPECRPQLLLEERVTLKETRTASCCRKCSNVVGKSLRSIVKRYSIYKPMVLTP